MYTCRPDYYVTYTSSLAKVEPGIAAEDFFRDFL